MVWIECTGVPGALGDETNIGASLGGCRVEDDNGADIVSVCSGLKERRNKYGGNRDSRDSGGQTKG
jgi:hypothetical protein